MLPAAMRSAPAEGEEAIDALAKEALRAIAKRREVRDEPDEPEDHRDGEVGADREHVPKERALEVRPDVHLVRDREEIIVEPGATGMERREDTRAEDGEDRHRFGEAVDARPPVLPKEEEDGGDERPCVADADPPNEVGDIPGPISRGVITPDANADRDEVGDRGAH